MIFVEVKCPNCSAPLKVTSGNQSATCLYCRTSFEPHPKVEASKRSANATEKIASEISLKRLKHEKSACENLLAGERYMAELPFLEAKAAAENQISEFKEKRNKNIDIANNGLYASLKLAVFFGLIAAFSGWTFMWYVTSIMIVITVGNFLYAMYLERTKPPAAPPLPPVLQSKEEIQLKSKLDLINAEIARHRAVLGSIPS